MKQITTWIIVGLSLIVVILTITLFQVWPPEYEYRNAGQLLVRIHRGDHKTQILLNLGGWQDVTEKPPQR